MMWDTLLWAGVILLDMLILLGVFYIGYEIGKDRGEANGQR